MDAMVAMLTRRSIRKYRQEPVSDELVRDLLKAAMAAPSAGNAQPWRFVVVRDRELLAAVPSFHPYARMVPDAPLAILVCADTSVEKHVGFWAQDCAAATQNLLLAAHAHRLGAVWTGIYPYQERVDACRALFKLPEHIMPLALTPIGWPAENQPLRDNYLQEHVFLDAWGQAQNATFP